MNHAAAQSRESLCYETSLLYFHFDDKSSAWLSQAAKQAVNRTTKRLIIVLISTEFDPTQHACPASSWGWVQNILVLAYVSAAHAAQDRDDPLFASDVILVSNAGQAAQQLSTEKWDAVITLEGGMERFIYHTW
jgi:hypothetical protein